MKTNSSGGGINCGYSAALVEDCWFENNLAGGGGGLGMGNASQVVRRCTFVRNSGGGGLGGAIDALGASVVIEDNSFFGSIVTTNWLDGASAVLIRGAGDRVGDVG